MMITFDSFIGNDEVQAFVDGIDGGAMALTLADGHWEVA